MKKLLIATRNKGKLQEFKQFLSDIPATILSLDDLKITEEVEEDGKTYKENSQKKALFYAKLSGLPTIVDDGGIEIDALGRAPGIKSKRWLGEETTEEDLIRHMVKVAKNLPDENRKAVFRVVISLATPEGKVLSVEEAVEGIITKRSHMKRVQGYPYRSFFYIPEIKKYYHEDELTNDEQRMYNHRYKGIKKLRSIIKKTLEL